MDDTTEPDWGYEDCRTPSNSGPALVPSQLRADRAGPDGDIGYWGRIWTAMSSSMSIPTVVAAPPGIRTHLDLPSSTTHLFRGSRSPLRDLLLKARDVKMGVPQLKSPLGACSTWS